MRTINFTAKLEPVQMDFNTRTARRGGKIVYSFDLMAMPKINPDDFLFCRVRACSADEPNRNGDAFPYDELKRSYHTFIGKGVYQDHNTGSIDNMRGIILDAVWREADEAVDGGKAWVELLLAVDKSYVDLCRKIKNGSLTDVSMGCTVKYGECSVCGNICRGETNNWGEIIDMCDHIRFHKGEVYNGKRVYEKCYDVEFIEISAVTDGADPQALILDNDIRVEADIPEHLFNVVDFPNESEGRKKVASIDYSNVYVRDLPDDMAERIFEACKKVDLQSYWNLFQTIQTMTLRQAQEFVVDGFKRHAETVIDSITINGGEKEMLYKRLISSD